MTGELKVMKARRALDPAELRDPLGEDTSAPSEAVAKRRRRPEASVRKAKSRAAAPAPSIAPHPEAPPIGGDLATMVDLIAGPRSAVAVMFDPDVWARLAELVAELRGKRIRMSLNALLVLILAEGLPADETAALNLVGRRELELADRGPLPQREEHTVRLPRNLAERYTRLGKEASARGFAARSAVINAVVAIAGPKTAAEAAALELRARQARAAAVVRDDAAPAA